MSHNGHNNHSIYRPTPTALAAAAAITPAAQAPAQQQVQEQHTARPPKNRKGGGSYQKISLTHKQFHALCMWVMQPGKLDGTDVHADVAQRAADELGFPVSHTSIPDVLETAGVKMPANSYAERRRLKGATGDEVQRLAAFVAMLARKLGETVPDHITDIYKERRE
jgi:hypothetical protein